MPLPWNEVRCVFCGRTFAVSFAKTGPNMGKIIPRLHPRILQCEPKCLTLITTKDDGWPESEKGVFQAALRMVVVKDSR